MSDAIGDFTLTATVPGAKPDLAALEAKRKRLQAELDAVNAEIEALKKKK
jgi:Skp family chaperone for outer membrane proteins